MLGIGIPYHRNYRRAIELPYARKLELPFAGHPRHSCFFFGLKLRVQAVCFRGGLASCPQFKGEGILVILARGSITVFYQSAYGRSRLALESLHSLRRIAARGRCKAVWFAM